MLIIKMSKERRAYVAWDNIRLAETIINLL